MLLCGNRSDGQNDRMAWWKILALGYKAHRGWRRIPPAQRRRMIEGASKQAREHGPVIAKRIGTAVQQARKGR
jgi:hypothetical protein